MSDIAIRVENLSKRYTITALRYRHDTLRDQIMEGLKSVFRRNGQPDSRTETIWALKDVSFEVKRGEVLGVIGRNGAGKSTLLKILSRIIDPTLGRAAMFGRVGSLLEVGTGFDRELTGRENIYLNGAIFGMKKAEIDRKFDEILSFSEVEKFIDTPVKRYSSGMYVRLAFAVAAHLDPEILIVDEVLAVGDANFQKKCLGKMGDAAKKGRTVLLVTHNMSSLLRLCPESILLDQGELVFCAKSSEVVERYLRSGNHIRPAKAWSPNELPSTCGPFRPIALRVCDANGNVTSLVRCSEPFSIAIQYQITEPVRNLQVVFKLYSTLGQLVFISADLDNPAHYERYLTRVPGHYVSRCHIPANLLNRGTFVVGISATVPHVRRYFWEQESVELTVHATGAVGEWGGDRGGFFRPALQWEIESL